MSLVESRTHSNRQTEWSKDFHSLMSVRKWPHQPHQGACPTRSVNARAGAQARRAPHLKCHNLLDSPWPSQDAARTCSSLRARDRRPLFPPSPPTQPAVLRAWRPTSSGLVRCTLLRATARAPFTRAEPGRAVPSQCSGETKVATRTARQAICASPWRLAQPDPNLPTSRWWQTLAPPPQNTPSKSTHSCAPQLDGSHKKWENGHKDTDERREGEGSDDGAKGTTFNKSGSMRFEICGLALRLVCQ